MILKIGKISCALVLGLIMCACSTVTTDKYVSRTNGSLSASDGERIFFVQSDGLYAAEMDMSNPQQLLEQKNITQIAVNDEYLAFSAPQDTNSSSLGDYPMNITVLRKSDLSVLRQYDYYMCDSLYLSDHRLYLTGLADGKYNAAETAVGLYIMDFIESDAVTVIQIDDCQIVNQAGYYVSPLYWFDDENIGFSCTCTGGVINDKLLYAKALNHVTGKIWNDSAYVPLSVPDSNGLLALGWDEIGNLVDQDFQSTFVFPQPQPPQTGRMIIKDYEFLPDGKVLFYGRCNRHGNNPLDDKPLHRHVADAVYLLDSEYQLEKIYASQSRELILHADESRLILLKGRTVYTVDYEGNRLETLGEISSYGDRLNIEVCGDYLLFFSKGQMISSVKII